MRSAHKGPQNLTKSKYKSECPDGQKSNKSTKSNRINMDNLKDLKDFERSDQEQLKVSKL